MTDDVKMLLFESIKYETVTCPDAGEIDMLPYVSGKAMDVLTTDYSKKKEQFSKFYEASAQEGDCPFGKLSENDINEIAKYYCEKQDCLTAYVEYRQQLDVFEAFQKAISSTEAWKQWRLQRQRLIQQIQISSKLYSSNFNRDISNSLRLVKQIEKYGGLLSNSLDIGGWINQRRQLLRISTAQFGSALLGVEQVQRALESCYDNWISLTSTCSLSKELQSIVSRRSDNLGMMVDLSRNVSSILSKMNPLQESIHEVLNLTSGVNWDLDAIGADACKTLAISSDIVQSTGEFFKSYAQSKENFQATYPENSDELVEADEEVQYLFIQSQEELQENANGAVVLTNNTLALIKEQCGTAIEAKLESYTPLLDRLKFLANPESFSKVLHRFSKSFGANNHWKSLWKDLGEKFKSRPEQIAQSVLGMYFEGTYKDFAFVGRELCSGNGFVDLLVSFLGVNYIVEIKIVGPSWAIGSAHDGLNQLDSYMQTYSQSKCYLVVFDGRKTNSGKQLETSYDLTNGSVEVVVVKSYYDSPTN